MSAEKRPRVAVFQANWPLQVHTTNVVELLTRRGYAVDLFLYGVPRDFADVSVPAVNEHVSIIDLSSLAHDESSNVVATHPAPANPTATAIRQSSLLRPAKLLVRRLRAWRETAKFLLRIGDLEHVLPTGVLESSGGHLRRKRYRLFIGIERAGLIWAGEMGRRLGVPTAYYSLELYTNDSPQFSGRPFRRLKRLESRYHRRSRATIVQDSDRARILLADNRVRERAVVVHHVPVSLLGMPLREKSHYLHDRLGLAHHLKIILLLGQVHAERYSHAAISAAQDFPEDWVLVVHGPAYGNVQLLADLTRLNTRGRARISTDLIPESELADLVASADVGLAFYSPATVNEYWTGRASEKVARYAQAGVPMIAFDYPSFRGVFERYTCGRVIGEVSDLKGELETIFASYNAYRNGAFEAYEKVYEFSNHFERVVDWVDSLA